jgi:plasmid stabilization system protein ParE
MNYSAEITPKAQSDFDAAYDWLVERTPQHAPEWYNGFLDAMLSLESNPARCPVDNPKLGTRYLLFGNKRHAYRMIFTIRESTVYILHIRHAARRD